VLEHPAGDLGEQRVPVGLLLRTVDRDRAQPPGEASQVGGVPVEVLLGEVVELVVEAVLPGSSSP
jgi:hypothetical protein